MNFLRNGGKDKRFFKSKYIKIFFLAGEKRKENTKSDNVT